MWYVVISVKLHSPLHCDLCHNNICNACKTKHVSELSKPYEVIPFKERGSTPLCQKHYNLYCTDCNIPFCNTEKSLVRKN